MKSYLIIGAIYMLALHSGYMLGCFYGKKEVQEEAVFHGYATQVLRQDGRTQFLWKEKP